MQGIAGQRTAAAFAAAAAAASKVPFALLCFVIGWDCFYQEGKKFSPPEGIDIVITCKLIYQ
jgi:hypothetical protein